GLVCLGFGKTAVYAALGPDAQARVTAAVSLKPGPTAAFDVRYNPVKITALAKAVEERAERWFAGGLGPDDKMVPFWTTTVAGGTDLTVRQTSNVLTGYRVAFHLVADLFNK